MGPRIAGGKNFGCIGSEMNLEIVEGEAAASLMQKSPAGKALPCVTHPGGEIRRQVQPMVSGENPPDRQDANLFH